LAIRLPQANGGRIANRSCAAQRIEYAEQVARSPQTRSTAAADHLEARLKKSEHDLTETIQVHNQKCRPADAIVFGAFTGRYDAALFEQICGLRREIDRIYNILKNNVLVSKHEQLKVLKASFNDAFVSHLCQEIHQSIQDGKRQLDLLNKELVNHRFGSDREQFRFAQEWVPEYRDYARFFEEIVRSPTIDAGSNLFDSTLSAKSTQVRDALMGLLLGVDEKKSLSDLDRIADYRNYHRYEIYKEVEGANQQVRPLHGSDQQRVRVRQGAERSTRRASDPRAGGSQGM
jgi:hypothetical protein